MMWLLLFLYIIPPFVGLYFFSPAQQGYFGPVDSGIKIYYVIYLILFVVSTLSVQFTKRPEKVFSKFAKTNVRLYSHKAALIKCIFSLTAIIAIMFLFGIEDILTKRIGRGEFRTTLGAFGFLYALITFTLPAGIVSLATIIFSQSKKKKDHIIYLALIYTLAVTVGLLTGFKAAAVIILSSAVLSLTTKFTLARTTITALIASLLIVFSAKHFTGTELDTTLELLWSRGTSVAVEGTVATWNQFPFGSPESSYSLLYGFGNRLAAKILGTTVNSVDYLKVNPGRYLAYLRYPKPEEALTGAYNIAITNFGEGVYFWGREFCFFFAIISGLIVGLFFKILRFFQINSKDPLVTAMIATYVSTVLLPWLLNGAVANLFGLPTLVYILLTSVICYIILTPLSLSFKRNLASLIYFKSCEKNSANQIVKT